MNNDFPRTLQTHQTQRIPKFVTGCSLARMQYFRDAFAFCSHLSVFQVLASSVWCFCGAGANGCGRLSEIVGVSKYGGNTDRQCQIPSTATLYYNEFEMRYAACFFGAVVIRQKRLGPTILVYPRPLFAIGSTWGRRHRRRTPPLAISVARHATSSPHIAAWYRRLIGRSC